jgi:hypothetical protein
MQHAVGDELLQMLLVNMLQLASTTKREMLARRNGVMRAVDKPTGRIEAVTGRGMCDILAIGGYAVTARSNAYYYIIVSHSAALP